uniref:Uncharacterized protein n=1 Tax=Wuchereria bancrofti TaxID=6293 RepID=A0A1I8EB44_WUCBA
MNVGANDSRLKHLSRLAQKYPNIKEPKIINPYQSGQKQNNPYEKADSMTMLATVHPYSSNNKSSSNNSSDADKHIMKITDVTDQVSTLFHNFFRICFFRIDYYENALIGDSPETFC